MKTILKTLLVIISLALIPYALFASPVSVDRLNNTHIEPLIKTDYVQGDHFVATSTTAISTFAGSVGVQDPSPNSIFGVGNLIDFQGSLGNTKIGYLAGTGITLVTEAALTTAIGASALDSAGAGSTYNTAVGASALHSNNSSFNTCVGVRCLYGNTGGNNTAIGYLAGYGDTSSNNVYIDGLSRNPSTVTTDSIIHGVMNSDPTLNALTFNASTSIAQNLNVYGTGNSTFAGNVGISTTSPYAKLSVVGQVVSAYFTATTTTASTFPYASTTAISATTASTTNQFVSSLGIPAGTFVAADGKGKLIATTTPTFSLTGGSTNTLAYWTSPTTLNATDTPTVSAIVATSTTATSTFAGGITGPNSFTVQSSSGKVGIGTTSPDSGLHQVQLSTINGDPINPVVTTNAGAGTYNSGDSLQYKIYSYVTIYGQTYYSSLGLTTSPTVIGLSGDKTNVSWDAVSGATGYRVLQNYNSSGYVKYQDFVTNSFNDAFISSWITGSVVTPKTATFNNRIGFISSGMYFGFWTDVNALVKQSLSVGTTTNPTALIYIGGGAAAANSAPIKFGAGTVQTTPEAGTVEFDGTNFYMSPSTTRKRIPLINNAAATNGFIPIGNGTDYTTAAIAAGSSSLTVTNGAGSISINTAQSITTGAAPQFARLGVGVANNAANKITITAGTAGASQINFASGTARTSPLLGDLSYDGAGQNQIAFSNGNLQYWGGNLYTATADQTINTTSPTTGLSATMIGTTTIAANSLKVGQKITIWGAGYYSTPIGNTSTVTITPSIASSTATNISTVTTAIFPASAVNLPFDFNLSCTVRSIGASGTMVCDGDFKYTTALSGVAKTSNSLSTVGTIVFDTTVKETLDVKASWSAVTTQTATVQESRIDF